MCCCYQMSLRAGQDNIMKYVSNKDCDKASDDAISSLRRHNRLSNIVKLVSLPTWLISKFLRAFFRADHPWRKEVLPVFFSLADWHNGQTILCRQFDCVLWVCLLCYIPLFIMILR